MPEAVAEAFVGALTVYAAAGLAFALVFVSIGVTRLDVQARGTGIGFRLLILPGVTAFWPLFLYRWLRGISEPPAERNAHRDRAAA